MMRFFLRSCCFSLLKLSKNMAKSAYQSEPDSYALLVIDMQEHFRPVGQPILAELRKTIDLCRTKKIPVIFTQHGHRDLKVDGGSLAWHWGEHDLIDYGSKSWELMPELGLHKHDIVINEKRRYDAFQGTILADILRQHRANTVVISGVMTNLCCETTARSAFCRDFRVFFLSDGTGTASQAYQDATLMNIEFGFGKVMSCADFRKIVS